MSVLAFDPFQDYDLRGLEPQTPGLSNPAINIIDATEKAIRHFKTAFTNENARNRLFLDVLSLLKECDFDNWDGYDAKAVSLNTAMRALEFAYKFEDRFPKPTFCPDPDGEISIEWRGANDSIFSISVGDRDIVHYAAIFPDGNRTHGTESYYGNDKALLEIYITRIIGQNWPNSSRAA